jgi:3-oxoacyl-[acyl-carrier protein] reductase
MKQVVIVTGASRGVGRATALRLARDGASVIAVARSTDDLDRLADEAGRDRVGSLIPSAGDVRLPATAAGAVALALELFGQLDAVVNNAGIEQTQALENVLDAEYDATLDTNLRGPFNFMRAALPAMKAQRAGTLVTIASVAALRGFTEDAVYCASKFGVLGLNDALEEELRPHGIRVCVICPGAINTDLAKGTWSPPLDPYRPHYLQPDDIADAVAWVLRLPSRVAVSRIVLRPLVEPPYGPLLPLS